MRVVMSLVTAHVIVALFIQSSALEQNPKKDQTSQNLMKLQELLLDKLQSARSNFKINNSAKQPHLADLKNSSRKPKNFAFYPFYPSPPVPFGVPPPGFFLPHNKEITDNFYPSEWLSRTEPFKKNPPLLDSPTYYVRLPPNPYIYIPGVGYMSSRPVLSEPEVLENNKPEQSNEVENDVHDPIYKVPINFISNGKPTSVYQLPNTITKPESSLINLTKGPYVFNGKPNEIYLVAQIYNALYGDELSHFYP